MIEVQYRQTELDIARWQRLNQLDEQWRYYRLVAFSLFPSTVILLLIGSVYTGLWMAIAVCVMATYAVLDYLHFIGLPTKSCQRFDQFDRSGGRIEISQTISEFNWQRFEDFRETRHDFQFWGLGRCAVIPKHGYTSPQREALRELVMQHQKTSLEDVQPVGLFRETIQLESPFDVYQFKWTENDVVNLYESRFEVWQTFEKPTEPDEPSTGQAIKTILCVLVFLLIAIATMGVLTIAESAMSLVLNLILVVSPFLFLLAYQRMQYWSRPEIGFKLPTADFFVRLTERGIGFGNQDSFQLIGWHDLVVICTNDHLLGFTTNLGSTQFIPHRAIEANGGWDRFCSKLEQLRSQAMTSGRFPPVQQSTPNETNNPYQAPLSQ